MSPTHDDADLDLSSEDRAALGALRSVHPAASGMHKVNIAIASTFTVLLAAPAVGCLIWGLLDPGKGIEYAALVFGGLALLPAIGVVFLVRKLGWRLYLYDKGFVFARRGRHQVVRWDDVKSFYEKQDVVAGISADLWLRFVLLDGKRVMLDSAFKDIRAFTDAVRAGVTQSILARAAVALPRGEAIPFGKLKLSKDGLDNEGKTIAWADVHSITIEPRDIGFAVVVYKQSPKAKTGMAEWYARMAFEFANLDAFFRLAGRFTTVQGPARAT